MLELAIMLLLIALINALVLIPFSMLTIDFKYANGRSGIAYKYPVMRGVLLCTFLLTCLSVWLICLYATLGGLR